MQRMKMEHQLSAKQLIKMEKKLIPAVRLQERHPETKSITVNSNSSLNHLIDLIRSKTARKFLMKMIDHKTEIDVYYGARSHTTGTQVGLNPNQINEMIQGPVPKSSLVSR